jgi:8-oxo-dGTP pyrophosphatase MutT (NUDIX family)
VSGAAGDGRFARALADPTIGRIRAALDAHRPVAADDEPGVRKAAVALIFRLGENEGLELLLIKRAEYPGDPWSGQIAFPGGREEAGDASLAATAMRETREETGIDLTLEGMLLGTLDDLRPRTVRLPAIVVRPFVALLDRREPLELSPEVALAFWVPFGSLVRSESWRDDTVFARGIQINARVFQHEDHIVWGMTERILTQLLTMMGEEGSGKKEEGD